jgi:hypothetical protein
MVHTIPHDLSPEAVRQALQRAIAEYQARFPAYHPELHFPAGDAAEFTFEVRGRRLRGHMQLLPGRIVVDFPVPLVLRLFEGRARRIVDQEVARWLGSAVSEP